MLHIYVMIEKHPFPFSIEKPKLWIFSSLNQQVKEPRQDSTGIEREEGYFLHYMDMKFTHTCSKQKIIIKKKEEEEERFIYMPHMRDYIYIYIYTYFLLIV